MGRNKKNENPNKTYSYTLKIKVRVVSSSKEEKDKAWKMLYALDNFMCKSMNEAYSYYYINEQMNRIGQEKYKNDSSLSDEDKKEKIKEEQNSHFRNLYGTAISTKDTSKEVTIETRVYQLLEANKDIKEEYTTSDISSSISRQAKVDFLTDIKKGLFYGKVSIRNYKTGFPFPIQKQRFSKLQQEVSMEDSKKIEYSFVWHKIKFQSISAYKDKQISYYMEKILLDPSIMSDSKMYIKDKDIYFCLSIILPVKIYEFDSDLILGVDLGIHTPVAMAFNNGYGKRAISSYNKFGGRLRAFSKQYQRKQQGIVAIGGHGRKVVEQAKEPLAGKESNFAKSMNNVFSKRIVQHALQNKCGVIHLENLSFKGKEGNKSQRMLRFWPYAQLQTMIEQKAERVGIKVYYVNPAFTSQQCSKCEHTEEANRDKEDKSRLFHCQSCGFTMDSDLNAAVNIAKVVQREEKTE